MHGARLAEDGLRAAATSIAATLTTLSLLLLLLLLLQLVLSMLLIAVARATIGSRLCQVRTIVVAGCRWRVLVLVVASTRRCRCCR